MYTHISIIFPWIAYSLCYSNYNIFKGFDRDQSNLDTEGYTDTGYTRTIQTTSDIITSVKYNNITNGTTPGTILATKKNMKNNITITCPMEMPKNIGSYEVPTNKDIVIFTKDLLLTMFEAYERNAMALLVDIKEVSTAAANLESKCMYNKQAYRRCVKRVSTQSEGVTKNLVNSLQIEKNDVTTLTDNTICSLSEMQADPMPLIKLLAQETVMLKLALPGFLRLLNTCSELCLQSQAVAYAKKPLRRVTDQEFVVKHFLSNKNYIELIKDSKRSV